MQLVVTNHHKLSLLMQFYCTSNQTVVKIFGFQDPRQMQTIQSPIPCNNDQFLDSLQHRVPTQVFVLLGSQDPDSDCFSDSDKINI